MSRPACSRELFRLALRRASTVDPHREFLQETLTRKPALRATRLYDTLRERGYRGAGAHTAHLRVHGAPRKRREVFLRIETLPGEQAQADWAYVAKLPVSGGERVLWLFVIVLSHTRALWAEFVFALSV